ERGPGAPGAAGLAATLSQAGAAVRLAAGDAADGEALAAVIADIPAGAPLTGVVHAAGLLDDGVLSTLSADRLDAVLRPKADGAWHLHQLTQSARLEYFVLFSSVAGVLGNAGQASYAAANTFLDGLASRRRREGLPGVSLAWGPWQSGAGLAGRLAGADQQRLARQGLRPLADTDALTLLTAALRTPAAALRTPADALRTPADARRAPAALRIPVRLDLAALRRQAAQLPPLLSRLAGSARPAAGPGGQTGFAAQLAGLPAAERDSVLRTLIQSRAALVLGLSGPGAVEPDRTFRTLGFTSLASLELRNQLGYATGLTLPASLAFDYPTPEALVGYLRQCLAAEDSGDRAALRELDRLETLLSAVAADVSGRSRIVTRLEGIAADFRSGNRDNADGYRELAGASDDEIFSLIDNELGIQDQPERKPLIP
ncbi:MAG TPA: beta-ketoacyl reductase, partial [Trebonia sp.]